jgi:site-specific recombinase
MTVSPLPLRALLARDVAHTRLDELCEFAPMDAADEEVVFWFVRFVAWIRPLPGQRIEPKLRFLETQLAKNPEWQARFAATIDSLLGRIDVERLLAYGGIPHGFHLGGAVKEWFFARALPTACRTRDGAQILRLAFDGRDRIWLAHPGLAAFFRSLAGPEVTLAIARALSEALRDLGHQLIAQAHAPSVRSLAQGERSPYRGLYEALCALDESPADEGAASAVRGRLQQCILLLRSHREELVDRGAELNTTFQLRRMREQLDRLSMLASLRHEHGDAAVAAASARLVGDVLRTMSGLRLVTRSADLVVQNLIDSSASVGRKYLDADNSSWRAAFLAGAGGGALMAFATMIKLFLGGLQLPTLYEGVFFSLNYAAVFCSAYLLHFTIATKLPAHTAAALARSAQNGESHRARLAAFTDVWRSTLRLQLAGLVGNLAVAGPLAFGVDAAFARVGGHHLISAVKAEHVLTATSVLGPSFLFAALTGLFLWLSSLIGAFGDNWARVHHLADRLATNRFVMRRVGARRAEPLARAVMGRAGGLLGNASLGVLLGAVPAAFGIAHLPVEIRHITVSTSSVAIALSAGAGSRAEIALALAGLVVIATVNVLVSFALALWLALRATRGMRATGASSAIARIAVVGWASGRHPVARLPEAAS